MSKRSKKQARVNRHEVDAASVRERIARGRTKSALEDAKRLAKQRTGPESEALLGDAYTARAEALAAAGLIDEARELIEVARLRLPGLAVQWEKAAGELVMRSGDLSGLLRAWSQGEAREELGAQLEAHAVDLERIATAPELAEEDPLRLAAGALWSAFVQATRGRLSEAARAALRSVPRRSPLLAWRCLTLAIAAFHERDDDAVRAQLERIPAGAAVRPLADLLLRCVEGQTFAGLGPAARALVERLCGVSRSERDGLDRLRAAVAADDEHATAEAAGPLLIALASRDRRLALSFGRWITRELDILEYGLVRPLRSALGEDWLRIYSLEEDLDEPGVALGWLTWLIPETGLPMRRLDDVELALVLDQVAPAVERFFEIAAGGLRRLGFEGRADLSTPEGVERLADALILVDEAGGTVLLMAANLLRELGRRIPVLPVAWPRMGSRLLQFAGELDPTPERFRKMLDEAGRLRPREHEALLERWAKRLPGDVEPLLRLVEHAGRRSAHRKAESYVERAERLAPVDERVRAARFRVVLASLHAHLRRGRLHLCAGDFEKLEGTPAARNPERALYLQAARCRIAEPGGRARDEARRELDKACGGPLCAEAMVRLVDALVHGRGIDMTWIPSGARAVPIVLLLLRVMPAVSPGTLTLHPGRWLRGCTRDDMPAAPGDLALLCSGLTRPEDADLLHVCSGLGLRHEGTWLPRFLMYRWLALRSSRWTGHSREVRNLALAMASRHQDHEVVRQLRGADPAWSWRDTDLGTADDAASAACLARERALQGTLRERARGLELLGSKPAQKKTPGRPKRRRRTGLLQLAWPPMEEGQP